MLFSVCYLSAAICFLRPNPASISAHVGFLIRLVQQIGRIQNAARGSVVEIKCSALIPTHFVPPPPPPLAHVLVRVYDSQWPSCTSGCLNSGQAREGCNGMLSRGSRSSPGDMKSLSSSSLLSAHSCCSAVNAVKVLVGGYSANGWKNKRERYSVSGILVKNRK